MFKQTNYQFQSNSSRNVVDLLTENGLKLCTSSDLPLDLQQQVERRTSDLPSRPFFTTTLPLSRLFHGGPTTNCCFVFPHHAYSLPQGLELAIGPSLMDLKRATTLPFVTVTSFMLAGGYFVKDVPIFISWPHYLFFNYHTYRFLLKVQYGTISPLIDGIKLDNGWKEVSALGAMVLGYRLLAYLSLRKMKL